MTSTPKDPANPADTAVEKEGAGYPSQAQLDEALQGTDMGSDTRAGSMRGGSASGSDIDPDQALINKRLAEKGQSLQENGSHDAGGPEEAAKPDQKQGDDADAPTS